MPDDDGEKYVRHTNKKTAYSGQGHPSRLQALKESIEQAVNDLESEKKKDDLQFWKDGERKGMKFHNDY